MFQSDALQPIEKVERIRRALATVEDMLFCLSEYDGRDISKVFPRYKELQTAVDHFTAEHI